MMNPQRILRKISGSRDMGFDQKLNDSLNNYSRSVTRELMEDAPDTLTYVYIGPVDKKTRSFCLKAASQGSLTKNEIIELGGDYSKSLSVGGGFNCRHNWEIDAGSQADSNFTGLGSDEAAKSAEGQYYEGDKAIRVLKERKIEKNRN